MYIALIMLGRQNRIQLSRWATSTWT